MNRPAASCKAFSFNLLRMLPAVIFAGVLAVAPQPAFAQHGGGGGGGGHSGGGGGHSGGGHSGGGHSSGGSHGSSSTAPPAGNFAHGNSTAGGTAAKPSEGNSAGFSTGSHVWGGSELGSSAKAASNEHFSATNNVWQDPPKSFAGPSPSGQILRVGSNTFYATGNRSVAAPAAIKAPGPVQTRARTFASSSVPLAGMFPAPFQFHRGFPIGRQFPPGFFFGGCFGGFFPGFCGSGFFFGPSFWLPGCDPYWGCGGLGYGNSGDIGYDSSYGNGYNNGDTGSDNGPGMNLQSQPAGTPPEEENYIWQDAPSSESGQSATAPLTVTVLYFKDGSSYGVTDYWLAEGNLHYVTSYGGRNSVRADMLDLQRTVDENAKNGVNFVLRPAAAPTPQP